MSITLNGVITQEIINNNPECHSWYNVIIPKDGVYFLHNLKHITATTTGVVSMKRMFFNCGYFTGNLDNWDMSNVVDTSYMFAYSRYNGNINNWDVSNVKNMRGMFTGSTFNSDISNWNISSVVDMGDMFMCSEFDQFLPWDVSNVRNMECMFLGSKFNQNISNWNINANTQCMVYYTDCKSSNLPVKLRFRY
jgi:hypothetical protein